MFWRAGGSQNSFFFCLLILQGLVLVIYLLAFWWVVSSGRRQSSWSPDTWQKETFLQALQEQCFIEQPPLQTSSCVKSNFVCSGGTTSHAVKEQRSRCPLLRCIEDCLHCVDGHCIRLKRRLQQSVEPCFTAGVLVSGPRGLQLIGWSN